MKLEELSIIGYDESNEIKIAKSNQVFIGHGTGRGFCYSEDKYSDLKIKEIKRG